MKMHTLEAMATRRGATVQINVHGPSYLREMFSCDVFPPVGERMSVSGLDSSEEAREAAAGLLRTLPIRREIRG